MNKKKKVLVKDSINKKVFTLRVTLKNENLEGVFYYIF